MLSTALQQRLHELERLADQEHINWKDAVKSLPKGDDRAALAALATVLKFKLSGVFDPSRSLTALQAERAVAQERDRQFSDLRRRLAP